MHADKYIYLFNSVILAQARIQASEMLSADAIWAKLNLDWIPASAGMTNWDSWSKIIGAHLRLSAVN